MGNRGVEIKVVSNNLCTEKTIKEFNKRIAEIIAMKYSKEVIEKIINEYEKKR